MKKFFVFLSRAAIAATVMLLSAQSAFSQSPNRDQIVSGSNFYVTLANGVPWSQLNANYIFTPQSPNVGVCMFVENLNTSRNHTIAVTAFQTGNPSLNSFQANQALWNASQIVHNFTTVNASTMQSLYINTTAAANVAVVISGTSAGGTLPDNANVFLVQTTSQQCGSALSGVEVQGTNPTGTSPSLINPVLIGGTTGSQLLPVTVDGTGHFVLSSVSTPNPFGFNQAATMLGSGLIPYTFPVQHASPSLTWGGQTNNSYPFSGVDQAHTAVATAAGNTQVWPAISAQAWHVVCVSVDVTANATLASAGIETIQLFEAVSAPTGLEWQVFIPATGTANSYHDSACWQGPGVGAQALSDALNVNLSTALATGSVIVRVEGTQY